MSGPKKNRISLNGKKDVSKPHNKTDTTELQGKDSEYKLFKGIFKKVHEGNQELKGEQKESKLMHRIYKNIGDSSPDSKPPVLKKISMPNPRNTAEELEFFGQDHVGEPQTENQLETDYNRKGFTDVHKDEPEQELSTIGKENGNESKNYHGILEKNDEMDENLEEIAFRDPRVKKLFSLFDMNIDGIETGIFNPNLPTIRETGEFQDLEATKKNEDYIRHAFNRWLGLQRDPPFRTYSEWKTFHKEILKPRLKKIKKIILQQLHEYSKTGKRKYNSTEATTEAGYNAGSRKEFSKQVKSLLIDLISPIKRSTAKVKAVYDMIFGQAITSYHNLKERCENSRIELLTTPTDWFNIIKMNEKNIAVSQLKVKVKFKECNHVTYKQITRIGQERRGCYDCNVQKNLNKPLEYNDSKELAESRNLKLLSNKSEFNEALKESLEKTGRNDYGVLKWKCLDCNHVFLNSYYNIRDGSSCPMCNMGKEQKITHLYFTHIFSNYLKTGETFRVDVPLTEILPIGELPNNLKHHNVHVDIYGVLQIGNKMFFLAGESNGEQHEDSEDGWESFQKISRFKGTYKDWQELIKRDKLKVKMFKKFNTLGYYLIVVPHNIKRKDRYHYIIGEFESQTGIKLKNIDYIDWRSLFFNNQ
ncbi:MAG: hypothetical protein KAX33_05605 [Candidatus Lokiarchaeota archaeon]|nr:hypothetical protein [Candidatus Lokiarchaeota archaeon]